MQSNKKEREIPSTTLYGFTMILYKLVEKSIKMILFQRDGRKVEK
jgi:hypothetical protein